MTTGTMDYRSKKLSTGKIWEGDAQNRPQEIDTPAGGGFAIFGDGSDGDVTVNADPFTSGTLIVNNVLQRDAFFDNLTVNATRKIETNGYRVFVKGTLTNNGTIENKGKDGSGQTAGAALPSGSLGGSGAGGDGGDDGGEPGDAGTGQDPSLGGSAGKGGNSTGDINVGGAGGVVTAPTAAEGGFRATPFTQILRVLEAAGIVVILGGGGGGGGAGWALGGHWGGGGGSGGGLLLIVARIIANGSGIISTNGGDGAAAGDTQGGGGGGGGGGVLVLIYNSLTIGTETANGGTGGAGGANPGVNGSNGTVIKIANA